MEIFLLLRWSEICSDRAHARLRNSYASQKPDPRSGFPRSEEIADIRRRYRIEPILMSISGIIVHFPNFLCYFVRFNKFLSLKNWAPTIFQTEHQTCRLHNVSHCGSARIGVFMSENCTQRSVMYLSRIFIPSSTFSCNLSPSNSF